ncbi:citramalate synthase [Alicyclobacillus hesperidum subsp. aegles]|uniref:citramalate synthase n=1 Tax=Alicyclobacillus hesperidum TaxID=89784 RepID=UPI00071909FD|nr:citramalate synthase [Alicyclobacillus hesperidum]KRW90961.1 homocitrate synthase [Alicyclobacillus tengchongensis]GLG01669.1 citramalate synthase [Alicyclobacillus hesperidum subsp. aegles]
MAYVYLLDTTLRDGTQGEGVSLTVADKLKIAQKLDDLGVAYIEGGFPGANPKDQDFFRTANDRLHLKHAKLTAFGSTRRPSTKAEDDAGLQTLLGANTPAVAIVGKAWDFHVTEALRIELGQNLDMIRDTVRYLKRHGREVIFDAEHFFDGFKHNRAYALATLHAAEEAGVDWVALCDTNGGSLPDEIREIVATVVSEVRVQVGIHTHNDGELAVANTLAAVQAGARMVHGTINGIGERCGNANLASIIPNLELKLGYSCLPSRQHLRQLTSTARFVGEVANLVSHSYQPFVGHSAFAHKGGIHVSAIARNSETYEHIQPELVGNERRVLISELSGLSNVQSQAEAFGISVAGRSDDLRTLLEKIKELEYLGYQFEGAEASQELLFRRTLGEFQQPFEVFSVRVDTDVQSEADVTSQAIVKLGVGGEIVHTVCEGNGPVNALDAVLRKALAAHRPEIAHMHLTDYKVRVLDEKDATAAKVRVLIESTDGQRVWRTIGVSENVVEASWEALVDSMNYYLAIVVPQRELVSST